MINNMRFRVIFKNPDVLSEAIDEAVLDSLKEFPGVKNFSQEELTAISFLRIKKAQTLL
jgi:hypothetical protein